MPDVASTTADLLDAALRSLPDDVSDRKLRLFNCACVRLVWHLLGNDAFRLSVEVAERHVDGEATNEELGRAVKEVKRASGRRRSREWAVYHAVRYSRGSPRAEAVGVARNVADVARSGVPAPDPTFDDAIFSRGTAWTLFTSRPEADVDGQFASQVICAGDPLPADATAESVEHFREMQCRFREAEARDEAERVRAAADAAATRQAEVEKVEADRRAIYATTRATQFRLLQDIVGPSDSSVFDNAWRTPNVLTAAEAIYIDRAFDRMPALADLLEAAGCDDHAVLEHCRQADEHARGCWVLDKLLQRG